MLTDAQINEIEQDARRAGCANCWTGTSGLLAGHILTLLKERRELVSGEVREKGSGLKLG